MPVGNVREQYTALCVLGFLEDIFTVSPRDSFKKEDVLVIFNNIKTHEDLFEQSVVEFYDMADTIIAEETRNACPQDNTDNAEAPPW